MSIPRPRKYFRLALILSFLKRNGVNVTRVRFSSRKASYLQLVLILILATTLRGAAQSGPAVHFAKAVAYPTIGLIPVSVAVGDVNGDGKLDLVVASQCSGGSCAATDGAVDVLLGNGDGTFQPPISFDSDGRTAQFIAIKDLNGDGKQDLIVVNECQFPTCDNGGITIFLGNGNGTFQAPVTYNSGACSPSSVAIGDLNGDGKLDLIVANSQANNGGSCQALPPFVGKVGVLLGNGDGTFQPAVTYNSAGSSAQSIAVGDINGDGKLDVVVLNQCQTGSCSNGSIGVLLGKGDGTFKAATAYSSGGYEGSSIAIGDVNGDGKSDLVVANACSASGTVCSGSLAVLLGNGNGTFKPAVSYASGGSGARAVVIADVNGDGKSDLVVANACLSGTNCNFGTVGVLPGNGDGTFGTAVAYNTGASRDNSVATADVNGDGRPDILIACGSNTVGVLLNNLSAATTVSLQSSPNPSLVNQSVTFTATVTSNPAINNGTIVTFYNGATAIGTGTTENGVATLATTFSKAKTYTIKATYSGNAFHKAASGTVKQVVNP